MTVSQKRLNQLVFTGEMAIKGHFCYARFANDAIDTGRAYSIAVKQIVGCQQDTLARGKNLRGSGH
ncbi:hypothetical protein D3C78_1953090 [compost metagenome]